MENRFIHPSAIIEPGAKIANDVIIGPFSYIGAEVILQKNEKTISQTITDNFGDFKFDRLRENSGNYKLKISFSEHPTKEIDVKLSDSQSFPNIVLD